jgi:sugar phosphate isomerase/epimerase
MPRLTTRRQVLEAGAALALGGLIAEPARARAIDPIQRNGPSKLKLSCAAYSFRDQLTGKQEPAWTLDDFIDFCAANQLDATELTSYYFPREITTEYLMHLKHKTFLLGLDVSGTAVANNFCVPAGPERDKQIGHVKLWIDYAALLGAPSIRIFSGGTPKGHTEAEARAWCVECIEEACQYAGQKGVFLALENHGGVVATADGLLEIVRAVRCPWVAVNLDTGNFRSADPYADLAAVAPYAAAVQYKVEVVTSGRRQPADPARVARILRDANYRGFVALEYEAAEDPLAAVPRHLKALRRALG